MKKMGKNDQKMHNFKPLFDLYTNLCLVRDFMDP